jgi:hypothetical protein
VQHLSDQNVGFRQCETKGSTVLATYVPAAVAINIVGMYSNLEFVVGVLAPLAKQGNAFAGRSVSLYLVGKLVLHAMFSLSTKSASGSLGHSLRKPHRRFLDHRGLWSL